MTEKLYDIDSYLKEFEATVLSCKEDNGLFKIILDKTAFFPEAGGQKSDKGSLSGANVLDVQIENEIITHITDKAVAVGETVTGKIDFERRFDFMQQHSGEHILSGIAHRLFGCENVGFHLSEEIVTLDFDVPLSIAQIEEIELLGNKAVFANEKINCYYPDEVTLKNINYRSKDGLSGAIRIVEIENTDICACCAPHVKHTGEIGLIKILSVSKLRGGVRLEIKCGLRALDDFKTKHTELQKISQKLCVKPDETFSAFEKSMSEIGSLKFKIGSLKREGFSKYISSTKESSVSAIFETDLENKDLQYLADLLYKENGGIRAVFCENQNGFSFAICSDENLDRFFAAFKESFQVKGGGRNGFVQGNVTADKKSIENFFNTFV